MKQELIERLQAVGQEHLVSFWDALTEERQQRLKRQIDQVDFSLVQNIFRDLEASVDWAELAARAEPPPAFQLDESHNRFTAAEARERGESALRDAKLGVILVAGGQGTRLGFHHPKGMFPLGPISRRSIFQILIERLLAVQKRYGVGVPLFVMTSPATHSETVRFLDRNKRFGLAADDLTIFCQGTMPAVDAETGRVLLSAKDKLALSPDGHGGMLAALADSGGLTSAAERGVEQLFYGQIDNPLTQICDETLVGYHLLSQSEMTSQVVRKKTPDERVGNVVSIDGKVHIIEYSDLPADIAAQRNADGTLKLWAGNIATHVFNVDFLSRMRERASSLPFHRARKATPFVDALGNIVRPRNANSIKFERFIFDLLPHASQAIVVEGERSQVFAPVKNANGAASDTPATSQAAMIHLHINWLKAAGVRVRDGVAVEINPLFALDAGEVAAKITTSLEVNQPTEFR